jgi:hypothetical protein
VFSWMFFGIMFMLTLSVGVLICLMSWYLIRTIWGAI